MSKGFEQIIGQKKKKVYKWPIKHTKRCSELLVIRKMQTQTTMIYDYSPPRMPKKKNEED